MADKNWTLQADASDEVQELFPSLDVALGVSGDVVTSGPYNRLVKVKGTSQSYYVKQYSRSGRHLRRFVGRSRARAEWENLQFFGELGIPTAELVAFGERSSRPGEKPGVLVTREIEGAMDLETMVKTGIFQDMSDAWCRRVVEILAGHVATLHRNSFIHTDLKWRNILVTRGPAPGVFFIDCPQGRRLPGPLLARGIVKDLACLDKVGRKVLTPRQRIRFFLTYLQRSGTRPGAATRRDRRTAQKIISFFGPDE